MILPLMTIIVQYAFFALRCKGVKKLKRERYVLREIIPHPLAVIMELYKLVIITYHCIKRNKSFG